MNCIFGTLFVVSVVCDNTPSWYGGDTCGGLNSTHPHPHPPRKPSKCIHLYIYIIHARIYIYIGTLVQTYWNIVYIHNCQCCLVQRGRIVLYIIDDEYDNIYLYRRTVSFISYYPVGRELSKRSPPSTLVHCTGWRCGAASREKISSVPGERDESKM